LADVAKEEDEPVDMSRVWPIVCQYGIGAVLGAIGIWCGIRSGYLDLANGEDRRLLAVLVGGFLLLLATVCLFTFWAPFWSPPGATP
jgi:hypothetical protein